ncbi:hypothetical protein [Spirillospora sp. CA-294931]|uniref:hypothetical protein n=1 Tax=Spirillospora sp. CA-294931 TaxID=3240042 RepID=UPI003D92C8A3
MNAPNKIRVVLAVLFLAVAVVALCGCEAKGFAPEDPGGPSGTVVDRDKHHNKVTRYRLPVRPDAGGSPVKIRAKKAQRTRCPVGAAYPRCAKGRAR